jgi:hypothetical protein
MNDEITFQFRCRAQADGSTDLWFTDGETELGPLVLDADQSDQLAHLFERITDVLSQAAGSPGPIRTPWRPSEIHSISPRSRE